MNADNLAYAVTNECHRQGQQLWISRYIWRFLVFSLPKETRCIIWLLLSTTMSNRLLRIGCRHWATIPKQGFFKDSYPNVACSSWADIGHRKIKKSRKHILHQIITTGNECCRGKVTKDFSGGGSLLEGRMAWRKVALRYAKGRSSQYALSQV